METKHTPATSLPWAPSEEYSPICPYIQSPQDEDYACHTANAYPRLIEILRSEFVTRDQVRAILRELGELE